MLDRFIRTPESAADLVAKIETRLTEAQKERDNAQAELGILGLAIEEEGPATTISADRATKRLARAEAEITKVSATLKTAKAAHAEALRAGQLRKEHENWKKCEVIIQKRESLANVIETLAAQLNGNLVELQQLGIELNETAPGKRNGYFSHSMLTPAAVTNAFRQQLAKLGCHWAFRATWGVESLPTLSQSVAEGNGWILSGRTDPEKESVSNG